MGGAPTKSERVSLRITAESNAIVVDAKNDRAKAFYQRYGFVAFADAPDRPYLPLDSILRTRPSDAPRPRDTP